MDFSLFLANKFVLCSKRWHGGHQECRPRWGSFDAKWLLTSVKNCAALTATGNHFKQCNTGCRASSFMLLFPSSYAHIFLSILWIWGHNSSSWPCACSLCVYSCFYGGSRAPLPSPSTFPLTHGHISGGTGCLCAGPLAQLSQGWIELSGEFLSWNCHFSWFLAYFYSSWHCDGASMELDWNFVFVILLSRQNVRQWLQSNVGNVSLLL